MNNKRIAFIGGSIIIATVLLFNKEIRSMIPVSTGNVAHDLINTSRCTTCRFKNKTCSIGTSTSK